jgi:peroxiredoxin
MNLNAKLLFTLIASMLLTITSAFSQAGQSTTKTYPLGQLKPTDSQLKVKSGDLAPDFTLSSVSGKKITLSQYRGKKNVVLSFVPAAWSPVCSEQWPGYAMLKDTFDKKDTVLLGITVDNIPTLHAWTQHIGSMWFEVLSDFWPHGAVADKYGVLRSDGLAERALFFIDEKGIIRAIVVMDINKKPDVKVCFRDIDKLSK